jgi:hypothetical protein
VSLAGATRIKSAVTKTVSAGGVIAVFAMAGLLVSACGSSGSSSNPSPSPTPTPTPTPKPTLVASVDASMLVTAADASAAIGTTVTSMSGAGGASVPGLALYGTPDGKTIVLVFAQSYPSATAANAVSPEQMAAVMSAYGSIANAKLVTGIGDKAIEYNLTSSGGAGIMIFVFKANVVLMVAISPSTSSTAVEQLATSAAAKLH